jgi:hypothetical protein
MNIAVKVGLGFLSFKLLRLAGVPLETFLVLIGALVIGWPIGWGIGTFIRDETDVDTDGFKAVAWANVIAWIFPILGMAVASLTSSIAKESMKSRLFYDGMSILGYGLVVVSVALYVPLIIPDSDCPDLPERVAQIPKAIPSGKRSFARCPYAAAEGWSRIEIETYCNREPTEQDMREFEEEQKRRLASQD